ncbi:MAG: DUF1186 domain-containing protein [Thermoproteota archaeon]|nr:DUF1186 domain-containing protein [Thermoproteota archaeon]
MGTAETIIANKEKSLPLLINILGKTEVWEPPYKEYSTWTPIAIIHLLSLMGGKDAFEAVKKSTVKYYDDAGDWITDDFPSVIATFGPEMFDEISYMLQDNTIDIWIRVGCAKSLFMISTRVPEMKEKSVKILKETISNEIQDKNSRTLLINELANFKDTESLSFIKQFFINKLLDESIVTFEEVCDVYDGQYDYLETDNIKNPLHIFKADSFYRKTNEGEFLKENADRPDNITSGKTGRNDSCPCGSGKKYKKCCKDI